MSWLKNFLKPKQDRFMKNLILQAELNVVGLDALMEYMKSPNEENAEKVHKAENEADEVRRILVDDLNRTFVTPLDREDIFNLSRAVDDILDYAWSTVDEMRVLDVKPNEYLIRMVSLLRDAAQEIFMSMKRITDHPNVANDHAVRAKALENRIEKIYREAVGALFKGPKDIDNIICMLKLREIYRHLSNAADRGDVAANIVSDIIVKMT